MTNLLTGRKGGPLFALADVMVTPKEVKRWLQPKVDASVAQSLKDKAPVTKARANAIRDANRALEKRFFSAYGKKKMIDKAVARAMRGYRSKLRSKMLDDLRRAKEEQSIFGDARVKRIRQKLATGIY